MKKGYDDYANRRNIPHLNLYTKLIGMFYFWTGTNFILGGICALYMDQKEYMVGGLFLGLLMYSMIKDKTRDIRKNQRDLVAVLGDGTVHAVCTFAVIYVLSFRLMIIVYIFEVFSVAVAVVRYFKQQKGQNLKKKRR